MIGKIVQICSGADGNLYGLTDKGEVLRYTEGFQPGDSGQGRIYDGWTEGWYPLKNETSAIIPHQLRMK